MAVIRDSVPCINFLTKWGAKVNKRGGGSISTPIMEAAKSGSDKALRRLLELGASINDNGADSTHLHECAVSDDADAMSALVRFGAAVNLAEEVTGKTALIEAVESEAERCVALLLESGADYNVCDPLSGCDALHSAVMGESEECIRLLIKHGADINSKNSVTKIGALEEAAIAKSEVGVAILLDVGAKPSFLRASVESKSLAEKIKAVLDWGERVSSPAPGDEDITVGGLQHQPQQRLRPQLSRPSYVRPRALYPTPVSLYGMPQTYQHQWPASNAYYGGAPFYHYPLPHYYH